MIGFKILLTGAVVLVFTAIIRNAIDPNIDTSAYNVIAWIASGALITMLSGALIMVWSL